MTKSKAPIALIPPFGLLLLGKGINYSRSPEFFKQLFGNEGINGAYGLLDVNEMPDIKQLASQNERLLGLNVTQPYKIEAYAQMDELSEASQAIGAINTIVIERDGNGLTLHGHNTDVIGFERDCLAWVGDVSLKRALVLGTGGAALAARFALQEAGWDVGLVSRRSAPNVITYSDLTADLLSNYTLIVNATPVGQNTDLTQLPFHYEGLSSKHFMYDMAYSQPLTSFLAQAKAKGAQAKNGEGMLKEQALASWALWKAELNRRISQTQSDI